MNGLKRHKILKLQEKLKHCTGCKSDLELSSFNRNVSTRDGLQNYCKSCKAKATVNWRNGIANGYLEQMKLAQDFKCAICEIKTEKLVIDHCHVTDKIRSLLCRKCNGMLGMASESPLILQRAIDYIESWTEE